MKTKIALLGLTCCTGCEVNLLRLDSAFLDLAQVFYSKYSCKNQVLARLSYYSQRLNPLAAQIFQENIPDFNNPFHAKERELNKLNVIRSTILGNRGFSPAQ